MLCIIFTQKKLLAGVSLQKSEILSIKGEDAISYKDHPEKVMDRAADDIISAYEGYVKEKGLEPEEKIPTVLAFPVDANHVEKTKLFEQIKTAIQNGKYPKLSLIHIDSIPVAYAYGSEDQAEITAKPGIILEALGDHLNICYYKVESAKNKESGFLYKQWNQGLHQFPDLHTVDSINYAPLKTFGKTPGKQNVFREIVKEFEASGLQISNSEKDQIQKNLDKLPVDEKIQISKTVNNIDIQATLKFPRDRYDDSLTANRVSLASRLNQAKLDRLGVKSVVLLGSFLDNQKLDTFFEKELKIKNKLKKNGISTDMKAVESILKGMTVRAQEILEAEVAHKKAEEERIRQEEERKRKEEEERRKRAEEEARKKLEAERKSYMSREQLLQDIRISCTDLSKEEQYKDDYIQKGIELGIPKEVTIWTIQEAIKSAQLKLNLEESQPAVEPVASTSVKDPLPIIEEKKEELPQEPEAPKAEEEEEFIAPIEQPAPTVEVPQELIGGAFTVEAIRPEKEEESEVETEEVEKKPEPEVAQEEEKVELAPVAIPEMKEEMPTEAPTPATEEIKQEKPVVEETPVVEAIPEPEKVLVPVAETTANVTSAVKEKVAAVATAEVTEEKPVTEKIENTEEESADGHLNIQPELNGDPNKSIEEIFEISGVLLDPEFITKKVTHIINHDTKVIKILPTEDLENEARVKAFEIVYQKELVYYQELSEIFQAKEGKYYFRTYIERNTLKDYVRKTGLDKKDSFEKLNSNDLKLILEVWREVKGLSISHSNLSEYNILVLTKRKWNFSKDMEIKLVGFTSGEASEKEMEEQVHKIWSKLIGADVYLDFRKKFKI